jgi:Skp family chaperone for outer membrane proteins
MVRSRKTAWMALAIISAAVVLGSAAIAADTVPKIGMVDVAKIGRDAPRIKQYEEQREAKLAELSQKLDVRNQNLMLDENLVKELIDLKLKGTAATDKDKARIAELEKTEKDRDSELKRLQGTQNPSDKDKATLKELQDMQAKSKATGDALEKDYINQMQTKTQELNEKAKTDMQEAVNKVAEAKGLTLVLVKDAVMFGGGLDITDDVIAKLDRKVQ